MSNAPTTRDSQQSTTSHATKLWPYRRTMKNSSSGSAELAHTDGRLEKTDATLDHDSPITSLNQKTFEGRISTLSLTAQTLAMQQRALCGDDGAAENVANTLVSEPCSGMISSAGGSPKGILRITRHFQKEYENEHSTDKSPKHTSRQPDHLIEANWDCKLNDSLPVELKPRLRNRNGRRCASSQQPDLKPLPASAWPKEFRKTLAKLARRTRHQKEDAHQKLAQQVLRRQSEQSHPEHYARELLTSDIVAVVQCYEVIVRTTPALGPWPEEELVPLITPGLTVARKQAKRRFKRERRTALQTSMEKNTEEGSLEPSVQSE